MKKEDEEYYVYRVKEGKGKGVDVKMGEVRDEVREIKEGVREDDEVILNGCDEVSEGMEVKW